MIDSSDTSPLSERHVVSGRDDARSPETPPTRGEQAGTGALMLALGAAARKAHGRAQISEELGYRLRARSTRREAARYRRLLVRQTLAAVAERRREPGSTGAIEPEPPHVSVEEPPPASPERTLFPPAPAEGRDESGAPSGPPVGWPPLLPEADASHRQADAGG